MNRLSVSGIYELFIPGIKPGTLYKYEIKAKGSLVYLKSDPYGNESELRPKTASIVADLKNYQWNDGEWMKSRKQIQDENGNVIETKDPVLLRKTISTETSEMLKTYMKATMTRAITRGTSFCLLMVMKPRSMEPVKARFCTVRYWPPKTISAP